MIPFELSDNLNHAWFFDLDGTIFKHNGLWNDGYDSLLPGVKELWETIPLDDKIIIVTARDRKCKEKVESFLKVNYLRYDAILYDMPKGERIMVNDIKPQGLKTSIAWNVERNKGFL